ncbi:permease [[Limnothrix rosea] IAM M-220]|uniref:permease n=1 Tax=[Limnothrix rosea] IAM M-220 TaxID=454133 RepID=UPI000965CB46|nr:permease [[Limnothrix rosea] IAM M-220]OKH19968.1 hypothetical protein NIES208_00375 [[Limnothrix rosea] IAM M-220]
MVTLQHWFTLLISQWLVALPWLIVGVAVSTGLFLFAPRRRWETILPESVWWQPLYGCGLGLLLPIGSCGLFPVMRRLLWQSGSSSLAIAFWLTAVSINPILLLQLWRAFPDNGEVGLFYGGLSFTLLVCFSCLFAMQRQMITRVQGDESSFRYPAIAHPSAHRVAIAPLETEALATTKLTILPVDRKSRLSIGFYVFTRELMEWSLWLLLGCGVAACLQLWVLPMVVGSLNPWSVLLAGFASPIGFAQHFFLASHWLQLGNAGHSLGFLLSSTFTSCISFFLLANTLRPKAFLYLVILLSLTAIALNLWLNFYVF